MVWLRASSSEAGKQISSRPFLVAALTREIITLTLTCTTSCCLLVQDSERSALREMQTKGARCTFSLPSGEGVLELMIATVDAVGFMTTVAHVKSRLKAEYPGKPPEAWQSLSHNGQVLQDSKKLNDIVTAMPSPFTPVHFQGHHSLPLPSLRTHPALIGFTSQSWLLPVPPLVWRHPVISFPYCPHCSGDFHPSRGTSPQRRHDAPQASHCCNGSGRGRREQGG